MTINPKQKGIATLLLIIAGFILIAGSGYWYYFEKNKEYKKVHETTNSGILKLYPGLQWSDPSEVAYDEYHNGSKTETLLGETVRATTEKQSTDVEKFYQDQFIKWGWQEDLNNETDGPSGSTIGYFQGYKHIFVNRRIKYADSFQKGPPQCPCFTIYSVFWNHGAVNIGNSKNISNWNTYHSDKYGFEFKHPSDVKIKEISNYNQFELDFCEKTICDRFLMIDSDDLWAQRSKEGNFYHKITAPGDQHFYYYSIRYRVNQKIADQILSTFKFLK